jgi:ABC-type branched-subunit amino acid transport system substrate-binding protein
LSRKQNHRRASRWFAALAALAASCAPAMPDERLPEPRPPAEPAEPGIVAPVASVGIILPQSGSEILREYGDLVLEGIRLGLPPDDRIELVIVDDGGSAANAGTAIRQLEQRGVVAVIGPLLSEGLAAGGRTRTDADLVILSPTAANVPRGTANVYSLNTSDLEGARALGRYAVQNRLTRVALLYPAIPDFREIAVAFREAVGAAGGRVVADVGYRAGTTTFAEQMRAIGTANAQAVFIAAPERDIRQIAPQIEYYGLTDVRVLGSETWTSEEVLRGLPARQTDGIVVAAPMLRGSRELAWDEFVGRYEAAHRRTLDNPYPALGYDAIRIVRYALEAGTARRGDVARRIAALRDFRGATGILSVRDAEVVRRPFLVRIEGGRILPLEGGE